MTDRKRRKKEEKKAKQKLMQKLELDEAAAVQYLEKYRAETEE